MRPATYESAEEAIVLSKWFSGRDGDLENTTFVLLDPSGKRPLSRGGRGPEMVYSDAASFASSLRKKQADFTSKPGERSIPTVADLRLGLNVAASDGLPLVVLVESDASKRKRLSKAVGEAVWSEELQGMAHHVLLEDAKQLEEFPGYQAGQQIYVLQPDAYGRSARIIRALSATEKKLKTKLSACFAAATVTKGNDRQHVREGKRSGISWKSKIPVSDGAAARKGRSSRAGG